MEEKDILIVDDAEENVVFLSAILDDHGYAYRTARDGVEALAAMRARRPDLVLLDIMMPRRSGVFVFADMKKDESLRDIPVLFITGASQATGVDITTGEQAPSVTFADQHSRGMGAILHQKVKRLEPDGLIEKPIDPEQLLAKIRELLSVPSTGADI